MSRAGCSAPDPGADMALSGCTRRRCPDAGATAVEYALVLTLLVAGSVMVVEAATSPAVSSVGREAVCVEQRPAPAHCHETGSAEP
jgi:hypothetical protein